MELLLIIFLGFFCCCVGNICIKSIKNKRQPGPLPVFPVSVAIPVNIAIANDDYEYDNLPAYEATENTNNNNAITYDDLPKYSEI